MKFGNKMSFGFNAVQAGQKSSTVNAEPRLIVASTLGKMTVTAPVSKALKIAVGENIMFFNNVAQVEEAIAKQAPQILEWAEANGVDINSREGQETALKEFTVWAIAKGVPKFDSKNNPILAKERYTKADKEKFIADHAQELVDANRDALIERVGNPDATDEELLAAITVDDVEAPTFHDHSGSKTATSGTSTGIGCQLNFTDTSVWNSLKADLGDLKEKKNRVFDVLLNEMFETEFNDGYKTVTVDAIPLEFISDEDPIIRNK